VLVKAFASRRAFRSVAFTPAPLAPHWRRFRLKLDCRFSV